MKKSVWILSLATLVVMQAARALEVRAVITGPDRKTARTVALPVVREADGALRATLRASEAKDAWTVEFFADCARASKGESGFWLGGRGVMGSFARGTGGWAATGLGFPATRRLSANLRADNGVLRFTVRDSGLVLIFR